MATYDFDKTLSRGTQYSLDSTPIVNGKIRLTTDTKRLYFDVNDSRFELSDFIFDYTESFILNNIVQPLPKFYLASDTFRLYKYDFDASEWRTVCDRCVDADHAYEADTATKAEKDIFGNKIDTTYARLNSPNLTGNPTTPTPTGDNNNSISNVSFVKSYVNDQISSLKNGMIVIVDELPPTGESGKIYLVPTGTSTPSNSYDEYIWSTTLNNFEKFGTTDLDLDGYINSVSVSGSGNAVTAININQDNTNQLDIIKGTSFLSEHPSINRTTSSGTISPAYNTTFDVVDSLSMDSNGHITAYNTKKVTMVKDVDYSNRAGVAEEANKVAWNKVTNAPSALSSFTNDTSYLAKNDTIDNASTATIALKDKKNQDIDSTYVKTIGNSGNSLRYTRGDDTSSDITVNYASNSGTATIATKDQKNQTIDSTYIKNVSSNNNSTYVTFTRGDDTTFDFVVPYALTSGSSTSDVSWDAISGKPDAFPPDTHSHSTADIDDFTDAVQNTVVKNADTASYVRSKIVSDTVISVVPGRNDTVECMMDFGELT